MAESLLLARMYYAIISGRGRDGRAPHYTELATELGLSTDEGREALHDLEGRGVPGLWLHPSTDYIVSFAPFSNIPTQYLIGRRLTPDGDPVCRRPRRLGIARLRVTPN